MDLSINTYPYHGDFLEHRKKNSLKDVHYVVSLSFDSAFRPLLPDAATSRGEDSNEFRGTS